MSQVVLAKFGAFVVWTVQAWLVWTRFVSEKSADQTEAVLLWWWYFLLGLAGQIVWSATGWLFVQDWAEWAALPPEYSVFDKRAFELGKYTPRPPSFRGAETLRGFLQGTRAGTEWIRAVYPGFTQTVNVCFVLQAAAQLSAGIMMGPSTAQTIAVLVISAASLASSRA